jgi:hypothetical protein
MDGCLDGDAQYPPLYDVRQGDHLELSVVGSSALAKDGVLVHLGDIGEQEAIEAACVSVLRPES